MDKNKSRQFKLHKVAKKIFVYSLLVVFAFIVSGFFFMTYLMKQVQEISITKENMIENYRKIFYQNQNLNGQINERSLQLIEINKMVDDLEEIISLSKNIDEPFDEKNIDLNLEFSPDQKKLLLQIIPNGNPVDGNVKMISSNGFGRGVDYIVPLKTPVYATADGIVEMFYLGTRGYGRFIRIAHAYSFGSMYGHLSEILVKKGDFVQKGQLIGYSGNTGNSNGAKLYYEVTFLGGYQNAIDYTQWGEDSFDSIFGKQTHVQWNRLLWVIDDLRQLRNCQETSQE